MSTRPPFGESRIQCASVGCGWQGTELDLVQIPVPRYSSPVLMTRGGCPKCDGSGYHFIGGFPSNAVDQLITNPADIEAAFAVDFEAEGAPNGS